MVLDTRLNAAILHIADKLSPLRFDVSDDAPSTFEELKKYVTKHRRMCVFKGGSDHTIYGSPEVNWAFRAWHDHCHLRDHAGRFNPAHAAHDFTVAGERGALFQQFRDLEKLYGDSSLTKWFARILYVEVVVQAQCDEFPEDQDTFTRMALSNAGHHADALDMWSQAVAVNAARRSKLQAVA